MNEELNKKLAEWAGFRQEKISVNYEVGRRVSYMSKPIYKTKEKKIWVEPGTPMPLPDEVLLSHELRLNPYNFTQSLDACFKWLVPKAILTMCNKTLTPFQAYQKLFDYWRKEPEFIISGYSIEEPALALCLAIEKLIDGDKQ